MKVGQTLLVGYLHVGQTVFTPKGPNIPEPGFEEGSAVVISATEVVLTGGSNHGNGRTMMKYNTNT